MLANLPYLMIETLGVRLVAAASRRGRYDILSPLMRLYRYRSN